ncbi:hypothetical protein D3C86_1120490 [compost metagenome]
MKNNQPLSFHTLSQLKRRKMNNCLSMGYECKQWCCFEIRSIILVYPPCAMIAGGKEGLLNKIFGESNFTSFSIKVCKQIGELVGIVI